VPIFDSLLTELLTYSREDKVRALWGYILHQVCPTTEGYLNSQEMTIPGAGKCDVLSKHAVKNRKGVNITLSWLVVECKAQPYEFRDLVWKNTLKQVKRYAHALAITNRPLIPVYGLIAIGQKVEFYKHDPETEETVLLGGMRYDLSEHREGVQRRLEEVMDNHLPNKWGYQKK
jgi:hypothetical protein